MIFCRNQRFFTKFPLKSKTWIDAKKRRQILGWSNNSQGTFPLTISNQCENFKLIEWVEKILWPLRYFGLKYKKSRFLLMGSDENVITFFLGMQLTSNFQLLWPNFRKNPQQWLDVIKWRSILVWSQNSQGIFLRTLYNPCENFRSIEEV